MKSRFIDIPKGATFFDDCGELYIKINASCGRGCDGYNDIVLFQGNEEIHSIDTSPITEPS